MDIIDDSGINGLFEHITQGVINDSRWRIVSVTSGDRYKNVELEFDNQAAQMDQRRIKTIELYMTESR